MTRKKSDGGVKRNLTIRFTDEEKTWLEGEAKKQFRPVAGMVRYIVSKYRREQEEKAAAKTE